MPYVALALVTLALIPAACAALVRLDPRSGRRTLFATSVVHVTNDACFALFYPLLPLIAPAFGWQGAVVAVGAFPALLSLGFLLRRGDVPEFVAPVEPKPADAAGRGGVLWAFAMVLLIGSLDNSTRGASLTFLPFLFT